MRLFLFYLFSSSLILAQTEVTLPTTVIARVGDLEITAQEFLSRFELTPGMHRQGNKNLEVSKGEFLLSLIAEKLLVQHGKRNRIDEDSLYRSIIHEVEQLIVRDALYRKEIAQAVQITEEQIRSAEKKATQDLKIYFLFTQDKRIADSLYGVIQRGILLESFPTNSTIYNGPDSAIARWGDVDEKMENAVYALRLNETAPPVALDDGYYIPKLMGKSVTMVVGKEGRASLRDRVKDVLRKRMETAKMFAFMNSVLPSHPVSVRGGILAKAVESFHILHQQNVMIPETTSFTLAQDDIEKIAPKLRGEMDKPFVTFPHTSWTLRVALEKMASAGLTIPRPTLHNMKIDFQQRLKDVIDQENLTEIGYQRKYHLTSDVREQMQVWRDAYLAQFTQRSITDTVKVFDDDISEVKKYSVDDSISIRSPKLLREKASELKKAGTIDHVLGALGRKYPITIFQERVAKLEVSKTPTMVFRFLGFGGRMFAVPFVVPNVGWIQYLDDTTIPIP